MTEVTESKPEVYISENESAPFLDYCSGSYKSPYPCPCPKYLCDGHCPCPLPPLPAEKAEEADDEGEKKVEPDADEVVDTLELMNSFENDMRMVLTTAKENHFDYFVVGVFIANHFPSVAWIFLSYVFSIPSINLIQQPNLLMNMARMNMMYLSLLLGICGGSQLYAMYCISNVFPSLLGN